MHLRFCHGGANGLRSSRKCGLLLLLDVQRMLSQPGAILLQPQLFAAGPPSEGIVVIAGLFTNQVDNFKFLTASSHDISR